MARETLKRHSGDSRFDPDRLHQKETHTVKTV